MLQNIVLDSICWSTTTLDMHTCPKYRSIIFLLTTNTLTTPQPNHVCPYSYTTSKHCPQHTRPIPEYTYTYCIQNKHYIKAHRIATGYAHLILTFKICMTIQTYHHHTHTWNTTYHKSDKNHTHPLHYKAWTKKTSCIQQLVTHYVPEFQEEKQTNTSNNTFDQHIKRHSSTQKYMTPHTSSVAHMHPHSSRFWIYGWTLRGWWFYC